MGEPTARPLVEEWFGRFSVTLPIQFSGGSSWVLIDEVKTDAGESAASQATLVASDF